MPTEPGRIPIGASGMISESSLVRCLDGILLVYFKFLINYVWVAFRRLENEH